MEEIERERKKESEDAKVGERSKEWKKEEERGRKEVKMRKWQKGGKKGRDRKRDEVMETYLRKTELSVGASSISVMSYSCSCLLASSVSFSDRFPIGYSDSFRVSKSFACSVRMC